MSALLKLLAHDLGKHLWKGTVLSGIAQWPYLYDAYRANSGCTDIRRLFDAR